MLIANARLLDPEKPRSIGRDVLIEDGRVRDLLSPGTAIADVEVIDATGMILLPGLVNAHTHSHNALYKGFGDGWSLELLLTHGAALNGHRTAEDHYWTAILNGIEMLRYGVTEAYDLVIHHPVPTVESLQAVVDAYTDIGLRAIVAPAVADRPFHEIIPGLFDSLPSDMQTALGGKSMPPGEKIIENIRAAFQSVKTNDLVRLAVAPTIPAQCTDEFLAACRDISVEFNTGIHTHLAESRVQAIEGQRRYGVSLTQHLSNLDLLSRPFVGAHGVWLDSTDVDLLAENGAVIAHNPSSNLRLASGIAPVRSYLDAGLHVAIGTDGSASSDNQNMFEAMRLASHLSRMWSLQPDEWLSASQVLEATVSGGAEACMHGTDRPAAISPGSPADLVAICQDSLHLSPESNLPSQIVNAETGSGVAWVMVNGTTVMEGGKSTRVSAAKAVARAANALERLHDLNRAEFEFASRMTPYVVASCSNLAWLGPPMQRTMVASR